MSENGHWSNGITSTERVLPFTPGEVFAAFERPERLAAWWGPAGFRNTFQQFEFTPGGRWSLVMHGPNGIDYPNESVFREIEPDAKIVIEHVSAPWFTLTVTLTPRGEQTHGSWVQAFENEAIAEKVRAIVGPANEQNLDRLQALLTRARDVPR